MVKQFVITLMNLDKIKIHYENCANEESARLISQAIFPDMRIVDIRENGFDK